MKILLLSSVFLLPFISTPTFSQTCSTSFTSHKDGSVITAYPVSITGKARRPVGGHVWILAHIRGFNDWYPQGNGERMILDTSWECVVYLGRPDPGYYEIAIAVVNDQFNQSLNTWVSTARDRGYQAIPFPSVLNDCPITMITVEKK